MPDQERVVIVKEIQYRLKADGTAIVEQDTGSPWLGRDIQIPAAVEGHRVSAIAPDAFGNRINFNKLVIPSTVTAIGRNALPQGRWKQVIIGYQEEYGWYRKGSFPMYGNEVVPIVWVYPGSYAEDYCKERGIKYSLMNG